MDALAGSSPPRSQENPPEYGGERGEAPAEEIGGEAGDDFMFAEDTFPSLPDFPCLSSPSSSTFSSSSSSNSSSAYTNPQGGAGGGADGAAGEPFEPASAGEGFDSLDDIDQLLDFASLSVPWADSEPPFPDVGMMIENAMSQPPHPAAGAARGEAKPVLEGAGGDEACMDAVAAGEDLPRFFMEWLTTNRENISAEDLRGIRLRRSTIEAAAARLGGGRQGTMQLLKLILTWVQNHHLQKKRPREAMEEAAGLHVHGQLASPGANHGIEFPAAGQEIAAGGGASWMPYQPPFSPPAYGGEAMYTAGAGQYPFHQSSSTSSVVVNSQPFSPPAVGDMHAAGGVSVAWAAQQYVPFPGATTGSYPMPPPVVPQPFSPGFGGQYPGAGHPMGPQRMAGVVEASATKEARKKRMARQRRLSCLHQQRSQQLNLGQIQGSVHPQEPSPRSTLSAPVTPSAGGWGFWSQGVQQQQVQVQNPFPKCNSSRAAPMQQAPLSPEAAVAAPPPKPAAGARQDDSPQRSVAASSDKRQAAAAKTDKNLRFLLQKVLKQSDVGSLGRIVLPKKEAELQLPELKTRDGISIPIEDIGTSRVWNMRYRFWPNNKSRMYLLENTGDFVRSNELQEGDFIVIYSDVKSGKYLIRGVKVRQAQEQGTGGSSAEGKHRHGCSAKAGGASCSEDGNKPDGSGGGCKQAGRSPHGARRDRPQGAAAASVSQMAVSI